MPIVISPFGFYQNEECLSLGRARTQKTYLYWVRGTSVYRAETATITAKVKQKQHQHYFSPITFKSNTTTIMLCWSAVMYERTYTIKGDGNIES